MKKALAFVGILFITLFSGCTIIKTAPIAPNETYEPLPILIPSSVLNIPLTVHLPEIEQRINKQFLGVLYEDNSFKDDNLKLRVTKTAPIKISGLGESIRLSLPIHLWVEGRFTQNFIPMPGMPDNFSFSKTQDADFDLVVNTETIVKVTPDWQLETITTGSFQWVDKPDLTFGPLSIPIGSFIEKQLNRQVAGMIKQVDKEITKNFNLKKEIEPVWKLLHQPTFVDSEYNAWLTLKPEEVWMSSVTTSPQKINLTVGLKSQALVTTGITPDTSNVYIKPLPKLKVEKESNKDFSLYIPLTYSYEDAEKVTKDNFENQTFEYEDGKHVIKVTSVEMYGSRQKVIVKLGINGKTGNGLFSKKLMGDIFMEGVPKYNPSKQAIEITQFNYSLQSRDVLIKSASWIFKSAFKKQMEPYLTYSIKVELDDARKLVRESLYNTPLNDLASLKGRLNELDVVDVYLDKDGFVILFKASGDLEVLIK